MRIYGNIVEDDGLHPGMLEFKDGIVTSFVRDWDTLDRVLENQEFDIMFPSDRYVIFPGFVDLGAVCGGDDEDPSSASVAALSGGITALVDISKTQHTNSTAIDVVRSQPKYTVCSETEKMLANEGKFAITPHHLYFNSEMGEKNEYLTVDPPLPTKEEQAKLFDHLDMFDYLISGHVPVSALDKLNKKIPGVPALDTFGSFVVWMLQTKKAYPVTLFELACKNPGCVFEELTERKVGRLIPGSEASFTVLNMTNRADAGRSIMSKSGWSPFDLRELPGTVDVVYYQGEKVVDCGWFKNFKFLTQS